MPKRVPEKIELAGAVAILEVARRLALSCDLDELLALIIDETIRVLECDRASLFLYNPQRRELFTKTAKGLGMVYLPVDRGIVGACARDRELINVPDAYADERFNPDVDRQTGYRTRNILSGPLIGHDGELVGVLQAINKHDGCFSAVDEWLLETLGSQAAVALQRAELLREYAEKQRLQYELGLAREIQQALLPKESPRLPGFQVVGWNCPADETGGDGYDFIPLPEGRLGVFLADACGHGIAPALVVSRLQAMFRVLLMSTGLEQPRIIQNINDMLCQDLPGDRFVTAFCGILHPDRAELRYCSAGQGPILHAKPSRNQVRRFNATYCPLGVVPALDFRLDRPIQFDPGDVLMLATDGFYEYTNRKNEQFGLDRLTDLILRSAHLDAGDILDRVREDVRAFSEGTKQKDDLTAVVIKRID